MIIKKENTIVGEKYVIGQENDLYRHYKGGIYKLICDARHTEDDDYLVIYSDSDGNFWARPSNMFYGVVELEDGRWVNRFAKITKK